MSLRPQAGDYFQLPKLDYDLNSLEKSIDAQTMGIHYNLHHGAYVKNLNEAMKKAPEWQGKPVEELLKNLEKLPAEIRTTVRNNGGGHDNHSIFWSVMSPNGGGAPTGAIAKIIDEEFGGFDAFKAKFEETGVKHFGSGWVWLVRDSEGKYQIISRPNQDSPRMENLVPIFGNDLWEHAYYLKYQNKRAEYLKTWWNVVDWNKVNQRLATN